jgi:hypothetical protein
MRGARRVMAERVAKGTNQEQGEGSQLGGLPFVSAAPTPQAVILTTGDRRQRRQEGEHGDHFRNPPGDAAGGTRRPATCVPGRMRATAKGQASCRVRPRRGGMLSGTCLGVRQPGPWAPRGSRRQPEGSGHSPALAARRPTEPIQRRHRAPGTLAPQAYIRQPSGGGGYALRYMWPPEVVAARPIPRGAAGS